MFEHEKGYKMSSKPHSESILVSPLKDKKGCKICGEFLSFQRCKGSTQGFGTIQNCPLFGIFSKVQKLHKCYYFETLFQLIS